MTSGNRVHSLLSLPGPSPACPPSYHYYTNVFIVGWEHSLPLVSPLIDESGRLSPPVIMDYHRRIVLPIGLNRHVEWHDLLGRNRHFLSLEPYLRVPTSYVLEIAILISPIFTEFNFSKINSISFWVKQKKLIT
jgi:hypothetical protein